MRHVPSWFPGAILLKRAESARKLVKRMIDEPYEWVKAQRVCVASLVFVAFVALTLSSLENRHQSAFLCGCIDGWIRRRYYRQGERGTHEECRGSDFCGYVINHFDPVRPLIESVVSWDWNGSLSMHSDCHMLSIFLFSPWISSWHSF